MKKKLYLYLIMRPLPLRCWYDQFESAVVCATSAQAARRIHPSPDSQEEYEKTNKCDTWVPFQKVKATRIGVAGSRMKKGSVVCSSFNAA